MVLLVLFLIVLTCYTFLFINSALKILYKKMLGEQPWTFKKAVKSWGYDEDGDIDSRWFSYDFSWGLFALCTISSPIIFLLYVFLILARLFVMPFIYFLGDEI